MLREILVLLIGILLFQSKNASSQDTTGLHQVVINVPSKIKMSSDIFFLDSCTLLSDLHLDEGIREYLLSCIKSETSIGVLVNGELRKLNNSFSFLPTERPKYAADSVFFKFLNVKFSKYRWVVIKKRFQLRSI